LCLVFILPLLGNVRRSKVPSAGVAMACDITQVGNFCIEREPGRLKTGPPKTALTPVEDPVKDALFQFLISLMMTLGR
ncbi:MAG TPA: hypothetical protein VLZ81_08875, partial [Blastocatellia bacterium]|nr:hypothetical protein [Blastocatellia bacterium]